MLIHDHWMISRLDWQKMLNRLHSIVLHDLPPYRPSQQRSKFVKIEKFQLKELVLEYNLVIPIPKREEVKRIIIGD
jgi:hypothetical protein